MQKTFKIPNMNCQLMFHMPIPFSKERFPFQVSPVFKLYNVKSPLLPQTTPRCSGFNFDLNNCCYITSLAFCYVIVPLWYIAKGGKQLTSSSTKPA